jgi:hypothetical protein
VAGVRGGAEEGEGAEGGYCLGRVMATMGLGRFTGDESRSNGHFGKDEDIPRVEFDPT